MGTILASEIIASASEVAEDESNVTWKQPQALRWINDAQLAIASERPDYYITRQSMQLVPGTAQQISGHRLKSVIRNMGDDGSTPGRAIRLVDRGAMDEFDPDWHAATEGTRVIEYVHDSVVPKIFYVSPPVHSATPVWIETMEETTPPPVVAVDDPIALDDTYTPIIIEWVCYRFFSRDAEQTSSMQRADSHFNRFYAMLGRKMQADVLTAPVNRSHLQ